MDLQVGCRLFCFCCSCRCRCCCCYYYCSCYEAELHCMVHDMAVSCQPRTRRHQFIYLSPSGSLFRASLPQLLLCFHFHLPLPLSLSSSPSCLLLDSAHIWAIKLYFIFPQTHIHSHTHCM